MVEENFWKQKLTKRQEETIVHEENKWEKWEWEKLDPIFQHNVSEKKTAVSPILPKLRQRSLMRKKSLTLLKPQKEQYKNINLSVKKKKWNSEIDEQNPNEIDFEKT